MAEQMQLAFGQPTDSDDLREFHPGQCPHELTTVDMSGKGNVKSECDLTCKDLGHSTWTNCRVFGSCTLRSDE